MATIAQEMYNMATGLWYTQADDNMRACGHPGVPGPAGGAEVADQELSYLQGAIKALQEVESKIKRTGWAQRLSAAGEHCRCSWKSGACWMN